MEVEDLQMFSIFVRSLIGVCLCFKVKSEDMIAFVVVYIQQYTCIPMGAFKLLLEGRMLKLESDLGASSIKHDAFISLVLGS